MISRDQAWTATEAAIVTGVPVRQVHRIIDAGLLDGGIALRAGARVILARGLVGLKLAHMTAKVFTPVARRRVLRSVIGQPSSRIISDHGITVALGPLASGVKDGLAVLRRARAMAASDPEILGGIPCFKGTRIPVHDVATMLANGDDPAAIAAAYPQLDAERIALAPIYAAAYPLRGRPRATRRSRHAAKHVADVRPTRR